jgi:hypothetical protein
MLLNIVSAMDAGELAVFWKNESEALLWAVSPE